ncbi:hypothetical protein CEP88_11695 [Roseobacter denitrificans]|nr:hypothetical protein CEP88_11695 [Roseobacter denitrificans]
MLVTALFTDCYPFFPIQERLLVVQLYVFALQQDMEPPIHKARRHAERPSWNSSPASKLHIVATQH